MTFFFVLLSLNSCFFRLSKVDSNSICAKSLFTGRLPRYTKESELGQIFAKFGRVIHHNVKVHDNTFYFKMNMYNRNGQRFKLNFSEICLFVCLFDYYYYYYYYYFTFSRSYASENNVYFLFSLSEHFLAYGFCLSLITIKI